MRARYIIHFYCLVVEAGFFSDVVECLPVDPSNSSDQDQARPKLELSILLTSCLTAIKNHVIKYCTTVYERNGKKIFWSIKNSGKILNKLKSRGFLASGLSTYDFSTLNTT